MAAHTLAGNIVFTTSIAESREDSISLELNDTADYRAYSDGSGQEDDIGASAILYKKGQARPVASLQAFLGPKSKHNTYEAEVIGAIMALWVIRSKPETIGKRISLYIDNQAVIMALTGQRPSAGQHLIKALRTAANGLPANLNIAWISSHSDQQQFCSNSNRAIHKDSYDQTLFKQCSNIPRHNFECFHYASVRTFLRCVQTALIVI